MSEANGRSIDCRRQLRLRSAALAVLNVICYEGYSPAASITNPVNASTIQYFIKDIVMLIKGYTKSRATWNTIQLYRIRCT